MKYNTISAKVLGGLSLTIPVAYLIYGDKIKEEKNILAHHDFFDAEYQDYLAEFGKSYGTEAEYQARKANFVGSLNLIHKHPISSFKLGTNSMSDWFDIEFNDRVHSASKRHRQGRSLQAAEAELKVLDTQDLKESIDWRDVGAITEPLAQGECGACWAITAASALEAAHFIQNGDLISVSTQQLIDCSKNQGNFGCEGGYIDYGFEYTKRNPVVEADVYPYSQKESKTCELSKMIRGKNVKTIQVQDHFQIQAGSPEQLKAALNIGPVGVSVSAENYIFRNYKEGIIDWLTCGTDVGHAILVVGYGEEEGQEYFIIKNSWGTDWGENGFGKIANSQFGHEAGICGIFTEGFYPQIKKSEQTDTVIKTEEQS